MKLPISIAKKLQLLQEGIAIPAAQMRHTIVDKMLEDGMLQKQRIGANRNLYLINRQADLQAYLQNHFGIANLELYIAGYNNDELTRREAIHIASNSKLKSIRTFKGFLVNSFEPIATTLNGQPFMVHPKQGTFQFIYDFEQFIPAADVCIVGIENPENFRWIEQQQTLFDARKVLFISRYPQSQLGDVMKWLQNMPNEYLHFGDFDFEGINIYLREYKKHLKGRAKFLVPELITTILPAKGNRDLYNLQLHHQSDRSLIQEDGILRLLQLIHEHKKVLEQEALIGC